MFNLLQFLCSVRSCASLSFQPSSVFSLLLGPAPPTCTHIHLFSVPISLFFHWYRSEVVFLQASRVSLYFQVQPLKTGLFSQIVSGGRCCGVVGVG